MGGGAGWANPLQTLSLGLVLTLRFAFGPELDNLLMNRSTASSREGGCQVSQNLRVILMDIGSKERQNSPTIFTKSV